VKYCDSVGLANNAARDRGSDEDAEDWDSVGLGSGGVRLTMASISLGLMLNSGNIGSAMDGAAVGLATGSTCVDFLGVFFRFHFNLVRRERSESRFNFNISVDTVRILKNDSVGAISWIRV
jgi:hypothetical protein